MDATNNIRSFSLKASASFRGHFQERDFVAANVIGMLEGVDPRLKDSYLIVSAHYDHLGIGPAVEGDSIYNGVFDNAIGVAAMLEMARTLSQGPAPRRSVIFLLLTGEEKGLLGSTYYVDHPAAPLHKTVANVNVDGVALFDTFNDIVGVGGEYSTLRDGLQQIAGDLRIRVSTIPPVFAGSGAFTRSDQIVFARVGIPAILLMEGNDYRHTSRPAGVKRMIEWGERVYHSPFDDLLQPMNFDAALQHVEILLAFCRTLADSSLAPEWKSGAPFINARLRSIAEKR
jgi:Zn-dependent M28 family amino/carboxypeptidase